MKKLLLSITAIFLGFFGLLAPAPVFAADDGCVDTAILGNNGQVCDNGSGDSVIGILTDVLDIMTIGIGIVGTIGITIVGIQYMIAADNEEQTRKAKRRMFEIVIGFAAYMLIYALLKWLGVSNA